MNSKKSYPKPIMSLWYHKSKKGLDMLIGKAGDTKVIGFLTRPEHKELHPNIPDIQIYLSEEQIAQPYAEKDMNEENEQTIKENTPEPTNNDLPF